MSRQLIIILFVYNYIFRTFWYAEFSFFINLSHSNIDSYVHGILIVRSKSNYDVLVFFLFCENDVLVFVGAMHYNKSKLLSRRGTQRESQSVSQAQNFPEGRGRVFM